MRGTMDLYNYRILPNGNMLITASNAGRRALAESKHEDRCPLYQEHDICNWLHLEIVRPETVGALTDALIVARPEDGAGWNDDGKYECPGPVWWDRGYMVDSMTANLRTRGRHVLICD